MKYLKTVVLENFQSHKYTSIDFDQGLNVILGPSDSGKTALIRGIKWALYNEPSGDYFVREGEREASVTLVFSDNTKVQRIRSKSKNTYILYKKNGDEVKYEGFGTNVPDEIVEEIGIKKIKLDSEATNAINIGEQLEGSFLLSEKTSTRAGAIGRLIGVNLIDDALKETLKDTRNLSNSRKITENRITKIEEELKEFEYLDQLEMKLKKSEEIRDILYKKKKRKENLLSLNDKYKFISNELKVINEQLLKLSNIEKVDPIVKGLENNIISFKYYSIKKVHYSKYQNDIKKGEALIDRLSMVDDADNLYERSNSILSMMNKYQNIRNKLLLLGKDRETSNDIFNKLNRLSEVDNKISAFEKKPIYINKLIKLRDDYKENQNNLTIGRDFINKFDGIEGSEAIYKEVVQYVSNLNKLNEIYSKFKAMETSYKTEKQNHKSISNEIDLYTNKYKDLLSKLEICPLCLSEIDSNRIDHIISHYN